MGTFNSIPGSANMNTSSGQIAVTPSATISIDATLGNIAKWTAGENETVNSTGTQFMGQELTLIITNDGSLIRTITLGTGFKPSATVVGTVSKTAVLHFVSDGTSFWESARTLLL